MADPIVEERHYHAAKDHDDTSAMSVVVMLVAIVLIVGFALFALRAFPGVTTPAGTTDTNPSNNFDVNVEGNLPDFTPTPAPTQTNP